LQLAEAHTLAYLGRYSRTSGLPKKRKKKKKKMGEKSRKMGKETLEN
jgi:hypothetical protein